MNDSLLLRYIQKYDKRAGGLSMKNFNEMKKWFVEEESGQGMVEYGLIIVLIAIGVILSVQGLRDQLIKVFEQITTDLTV